MIREHAHEGIPIDAIARHAGLSRSVLQRRFRSQLKRSVHQEILSVRIKRARELLIKTLGPTVIDRITPTMEVSREEIFGPVLAIARAATLGEAIDLVNANSYGNGAAIFTSSGEAAREFQRRVSPGMIGVDVPIPVPMAYYSFGGWNASLFGDKHVHGPEGVSFYTRAKVVTSRWPPVDAPTLAAYHFPTAS